MEVQQLTRGVAKAVMLNAPSPNGLHLFPGSLSSPVPAIPSQYASSSSAPTSKGTRDSPSPNSDNPFGDECAVRIAIPSSQENTPVLPHTPTFGTGTGVAAAVRERDSMTTESRRDSDLSIFTSASGQLGPFAQQQLDAARQKLSRASSSSSSVSGRGVMIGREPSGATRSSTDEVILEPPSRPFAAGAGGGGGDSRHTSAALSMRSGYASVLDGIPFNLSLSPEARNSQSSSNAGIGASNPFRDSSASSTAGLPHSHSQHSDLMMKAPRDSTASFASTSDAGGRRDTSYSLASEWNGAFAGMPIMMAGRGSIGGEAVPELPEEYRNAPAPARQEASKKRDSGDTVNGTDSGAGAKDERYSTDSLAMAAAVARSFNA